MRFLVLTLGFLTSVSACGAASEKADVTKPSVASEPTPERRIATQGCGGPERPATTVADSKRVIDGLGGAHKATATDFADYAPKLPRASFESGLEFQDEMYGSERSAGRIAAYRDVDERYTFVEVALTKDGSSAGLEEWAHDVLLAKEPYADRADGLDVYRQILVYLSIWTDAHGRDNIEYAIVMKGCERVERYLRIVRADGQRLDIEVLFGDITEPDVAAKHLRGFFDTPLSTRPPPERTFAHGHKTML